MRNVWFAAFTAFCAFALIVGVIYDGRAASAAGTVLNIDPSSMSISGAALATMEADGI